MRILAFASLALALVFASPAAAAPKVGAPAPAFTLTDVDGKARSLSEFAGKTVVLEWTNDGCPFVKKHYGSGNMQGLQKRWTGKGVVWRVVTSSSKGKQGHVDAAGAKKLIAQHGMKPTAYLLDHDGKVGKAYGATATPHMYVIDAKGDLAYQGAIDDTPTADPADIAKAKNYVDAALNEVLAGKPVTTAATRAYGCSVKYAD
jgi:peroxiredoxin